MTLVENSPNPETRRQYQSWRNARANIIRPEGKAYIEKQRSAPLPTISQVPRIQEPTTHDLPRFTMMAGSLRTNVFGFLYEEFFSWRIGARPKWTLLNTRYINFIISYIARREGVEEHRLIGTARIADLRWPRHIAIYLGIVMGHGSLTVVSRQFGRDHTTALHSKRRVEARMTRDIEFREKIEGYKRELAEAKADFSVASLATCSRKSAKP